MTDKPKVIRVNETPQQRVDRLRSEMHAVGEPPPAPVTAPVVTHDGPPESERAKYAAMTLDAVFEAESKLLLALPLTGPSGTATLWPKDRAQILKAIVAFRAMQQRIGPIWGANLDDPEDEQSA